MQMKDSVPLHGSTLAEQISTLKILVTSPAFLDVLSDPAEFIENFVPLARRVFSETPPSDTFQVGSGGDIRVFLIRLMARIPYAKAVGKLSNAVFSDLYSLVYTLLATENIFNRYLSFKVLHSLLGTLPEIDAVTHVRVLTSFFTDELVLASSQDSSKCELGFFTVSEVLHYLAKFHYHHVPDIALYDHLLLAVCHALRSFYASDGLARAERNKKVFCEYAGFACNLLAFVEVLHIHTQHAILGFLPELCYTLSLFCPPDCTSLRIEIAHSVSRTIATYPGLFTSVECYFVSGPFTTAYDSSLRTELLRAMAKIIEACAGDVLNADTPGLFEGHSTPQRISKTFKARQGARSVLMPLSSSLTRNVVLEFQSRISSFVPAPGCSTPKLTEAILNALSCSISASSVVLIDPSELKGVALRGLRILHRVMCLLAAHEQDEDSNASSNMQPVSNNIQPVSGNVQSASNNIPLSSGNMQSASNNVQYTSNNIPLSSNNVQYTSNNVQYTSNNVQYASNNIQSASNNIPLSSNNIPDVSNTAVRLFLMVSIKLFNAIELLRLPASNRNILAHEETVLTSEILLYAIRTGQCTELTHRLILLVMELPGSEGVLHEMADKLLFNLCTRYSLWSVMLQHFPSSYTIIRKASKALYSDLTAGTFRSEEVHRLAFSISMRLFELDKKYHKGELLEYFTMIYVMVLSSEPSSWPACLHPTALIDDFYAYVKSNDNSASSHSYNALFFIYNHFEFTVNELFALYTQTNDTRYLRCLFNVPISLNLLITKYKIILAPLRTALRVDAVLRSLCIKYVEYIIEFDDSSHEMAAVLSDIFGMMREEGVGSSVSVRMTDGHFGAVLSAYNSYSTDRISILASVRGNNNMNSDIKRDIERDMNSDMNDTNNDVNDMNMNRYNNNMNSDTNRYNNMNRNMNRYSYADDKNVNDMNRYNNMNREEIINVYKNNGRRRNDNDIQNNDRSSLHSYDLTPLLARYSGFEIRTHRNAYRVVKGVAQPDRTVRCSDIRAFLGRGSDAVVLLSMALRNEDSSTILDALSGVDSSARVDFLSHGLVYAFHATVPVLQHCPEHSHALIMQLTEFVYADDQYLSGRAVAVIDHLLRTVQLYDDAFCLYYFYALRSKLRTAVVGQSLSWRVYSLAVQSAVRIVSEFFKGARHFEAAFAHNREESDTLRLFYAEVEGLCALNPTRSELPVSAASAVPSILTDYYAILHRLTSLPTLTNYANMAVVVEEYLKLFERRNIMGVNGFIRMIELVKHKRSVYSSINHNSIINNSNMNNHNSIINNSTINNNGVNSTGFILSSIRTETDKTVETVNTAIDKTVSAATSLTPLVHLHEFINNLYVKLINAAKKHLPAAAILEGFNSMQAKHKFIESVNRNGNLQNSNPSSFRVFKCLFHGCAISGQVLSNFIEIYPHQIREHREAIYEAVLYSSYEEHCIRLLEFLFEEMSDVVDDTRQAYRTIHERIRGGSASRMMAIAGFLCSNLRNRMVFDFVVSVDDAALNDALRAVLHEQKDVLADPADVLNYLRMAQFLGENARMNSMQMACLVGLTKEYYNSVLLNGVVSYALRFMHESDIEEMYRNGVQFNDINQIIKKISEVGNDQLRIYLLRNIVIYNYKGKYNSHNNSGSKNNTINATVNNTGTTINNTAVNNIVTKNSSLNIKINSVRKEYSIFSNNSYSFNNEYVIGNINKIPVNYASVNHMQHTTKYASSNTTGVSVHNTAALPALIHSVALPVHNTAALPVHNTVALPALIHSVAPLIIRIAPLITITLHIKLDLFSEDVLNLCRNSIDNLSLRYAAVHYLCRHEPRPEYFSLIFKMNYQEREYAVESLKLLVDRFRSTDELFSSIIKSVVRSEMRVKTTQAVVLPLIKEREWILDNEEILIEVVAAVYRLYLSGDDVSMYIPMLLSRCNKSIVLEMHKQLDSAMNNNNNKVIDIEDIASGNKKDIAPGNKKDIAPGNKKDIAPGNKKDIAPGNKKDITSVNNNLTSDNNNVAPGNNNVASGNNNVASGNNMLRTIPIDTLNNISTNLISNIFADTVNIVTDTVNNTKDISSQLTIFTLFRKYTSMPFRKAFRKEFFDAITPETHTIIRSAFLDLFYADSSDPFRLLMETDLAGIPVCTLELLLRDALARVLRIEEGGEELAQAVPLLLESMAVSDVVHTLISGRNMPATLSLLEKCNAAAPIKLIIYDVMYYVIATSPSSEELYYRFMLSYHLLVSDHTSFYALLKSHAGIREVRVVAALCMAGRHEAALELIFEVLGGIEKRQVSYKHEDVYALRSMLHEIYKECGISSMGVPEPLNRTDLEMLRIVGGIATTKSMPARSAVESVLARIKSCTFPVLSESFARQAVYAAMCSEMLEVLAMRSAGSRADSIYGRLRLWGARHPPLCASQLVWSTFMSWRLFIYGEYNVAEAKGQARKRPRPPGEESVSEAQSASRPQPDRRKMMNEISKLSLIYASKLFRDKLFRHCSKALAEVSPVSDSFFKKCLMDIEALYADRDYATALSVIHSLNIGRFAPEERSLLYHWAGECLKRTEPEVPSDKIVFNRYEGLSRKMAEIVQNKKVDLAKLKGRMVQGNAKAVYKEYSKKLLDLINELPLEESRVYVMEYIRNCMGQRESQERLGMIDKEKLYYFIPEIVKYCEEENDIMRIVRSEDSAILRMNNMSCSSISCDNSNENNNGKNTANVTHKIIYVFENNIAMPGEYQICRNSYNNIRMMSYIERLNTNDIRIRTDDGLLFTVKDRKGCRTELARCMDMLAWKTQLGLVRNVKGLSFIQSNLLAVKELLSDRRTEMMQNTARMTPTVEETEKVGSFMGIDSFFQVIFRYRNALKTKFGSMARDVHEFYNFRKVFMESYAEGVALQYLAGMAQNRLDRLFVREGKGEFAVDGFVAEEKCYIRPNFGEVLGCDGRNGVMVQKMYAMAEKMAGEEVLKSIEFLLGHEMKVVIDERVKSVLGSRNIKMRDVGAMGNTPEFIINKLVDPRNGFDMPLFYEGWL